MVRSRASLRQGRVRARGGDGGGVRVRPGGDDVRRVSGGDEGRRAARARALRRGLPGRRTPSTISSCKRRGCDRTFSSRDTAISARYTWTWRRRGSPPRWDPRCRSRTPRSRRRRAPSSDPNVVAARARRDTSIFSPGSGCSDAKRRLRVFLRLDDPPERRGEEGRGVFGCGMLDCGVGEFSARGRRRGKRGR